VESDQGSGLKKYCETHGIIQRYCLRHFVSSLKDHLFGCYVTYLVKSATLTEFQMLNLAFCAPLQEAINNGPDPNARLMRARKEFGKAGLAINFREGVVQSIVIANRERWAQVSIVQKIEDHLPSTTNSLESMNGHLNASVTRNNGFWPSLLRLTEHIEHGIQHFALSVKHNFNRATHKTWALAQSLDITEMNNQIAYFHSTKETWECVETLHVSTLYGIHIPCCHQMHLGAIRPKMARPELYFEDPGLTCSSKPLSTNGTIRKPSLARSGSYT
jgi:hypothetical protein